MPPSPHWLRLLGPKERKFSSLFSTSLTLKVKLVLIFTLARPPRLPGASLSCKHDVPSLS